MAGSRELPAVIVFSILKESGPVITGMMVSGRVGAGIGAELGSMKVTEQIDAMEASAVDPFRFLVSTRVLACILMLPLLASRSGTHDIVNHDRKTGTGRGLALLLYLYRSDLGR
ncbi:MAG TPA: ABC transporter permease [Bryobacteraceae bacterium]|nr:ABC transporter permease [Bryobacteraceae bacterium]